MPAALRDGMARRGIAVALTIVAVLSGWCRAGDASGVDAVTSASVDAETGASRAVEAVTVSDGFSVAYAINDDGAIFIQARDLTDAYRRDELASDALFKGNILVIRGIVEKLSDETAVRPWLTLTGDGASGKTVRVSLKQGSLAGKGVTVGDSVQVRGVSDGMKLSVSVVEGEILE